MQHQPPERKPRYAYSALGITGGALLLWFELTRLNTSDGQGWFWILVAVLMILLGIAGLLQRAGTDHDR